MIKMIIYFFCQFKKLYLLQLSYNIQYNIFSNLKKLKNEVKYRKNRVIIFTKYLKFSYFLNILLIININFKELNKLSFYSLIRFKIIKNKIF